MGQPKAALDFGGIPLLTRIVIELKWWFDEIVIVAAPETAGQPRIEIPGLKIVHDEAAFAGPLDALRRGSWWGHLPTLYAAPACAPA